MANKGLKSYTKQISQAVGEVAQVCVNVNKEDANLNIVIPLIQTLGPSTMSLSLFYNYQDRNKNLSFGKGFNISTYKGIKEVSSARIDITDADGSTTIYEADKERYNTYISKETGLTLTKGSVYVEGDGDYDTYTLKDQQGNALYFDEKYTCYPTSILKINLEGVQFDGPNMNNNHGASITFEKENNMYSKVVYTQGKDVLYYVLLKYNSSQQLIAVEHYKENTLVQHLTLNYTTNEIKLKDCLLCDSYTYSFQNNRVNKITECFKDKQDSIRETFITYEDRRTTIKDPEENMVYVIFDANNFPLFVIDQDGNAVKTEYDSVTKKMQSSSSVIPTKNKLTSLKTIIANEFTGSSNVGKTATTVTDTVFSNIIKNAYTLSGNGEIRYDFSTDGLGGDAITAVLWGKWKKDCSTSAKVQVRLYADGYAIGEFSRTNSDTIFDLMVLGVTALKSYSTITLTITLSGNATIDISEIQILKKDYGSIYEYDENGNMIGAETGKSSMFSAYNNKGLRAAAAGADCSLYHYQYNERGNVISASTAYGAKVDYEYEPNTTNVTKTCVSAANGNKKLETSRTYHNNGLVKTETDELDNTITYNYDSFGRIKEIIQEAKDDLKYITEYKFDAYDNLTKIASGDGSIDYSYENNLLKSATLSNGTIYNFTYDDYNNLIKVSMNDCEIISFTYEPKTGRIKTQKYGENGTSYEFIYNAKGKISDIKVNGEYKYQFLYNQQGRLDEIWDETDDLVKCIYYDNDGNVIKCMEHGEATVEYSYDNLGSVNNLKRTLNNNSIYESFHSLAQSKGFSPDDLVGYLQENEYMLGTMFIGDTIVRNSKYAAVAVDYKTGKESEVNYHRYGIIPCVQCGLTNPMAYYPPASNNADKDGGCVGFWFYHTTQKYLLTIKGNQGQTSIRAFINSSNKLVLDIYSYNGVLYRYETNTTAAVGKWNFFGLNFSYRDDGEAYGDIFSFELYLNGECKKGSLGLAIHTYDSFYHIGYRFDGNTGYDGLESYITALMIGTRREISSSQMEEYYNVTKDYILNAVSINGTEVGFSIATTYEVSDVRLKQFEIYPLHNHYKSLSGKMPKAFDARKVSKKNKDRTFSYNNLISRYAYVADGCRLEYPVEQTTAGTILARAIIKEDSEKQYFFEYTDASYRKVGLYRGSDKYLYVEANNQTYKTSLVFTSNAWHTVGFSFYENITSTSIATTKTEPVRVYLDGQSVSFNITCVQYIPTNVSIGRQFNLNGDTYNPLLGQIEMLAIGKTYSEESTLNILSNELKSTTKISKYNELGQLKKAIIKNRDTTILSTEYNYASTQSNHTSRYVGNELIQYNSNTIRSYDWDKQGNVTKIEDIVFGSHNYKYNEKGFLEQEDSIIYKYDSNGNITKADSTTFGYDEKIKDRLTSVNGKTITYGTNPLSPTSYNGNTFTWEGRRLLKYNSIEYTYDEQGLRTRKKVNGSSTKYYYDRTNLITEVNPSYRLDFLYDAEDQLYGFIYNNTDKYYYVRDFMQNILGIIDSNGNLVVKYEYTAYGTITSITGSKATTIGADNPFRYKGYYYDSESNMYYCKSRYYVPDWCRWLNGDVSSLNPSSINGMNLFSYCGNNPISISFNVYFPNLSQESKRVNYHLPSFSQTEYTDLSSSTSFSFGLLTPQSSDMPTFLSAYAFYIKGSLGMTYESEDGLSLASLSVGVLDLTFITPKWLGSLPTTHLGNPNIYLGLGVFNVNAALGCGLTATAEVFSGTLGIQFGENVNVQIKGYYGAGFKLDFSNGIKFGFALGLGVEFSIYFKWW